MHFIYAGSVDFSPFGEFDKLKKYFKQAMQKYGFELAVLSIITMLRESVITKEEFDIEYGIKKDEKVEMLDKEDISVGEDLETFIRRIKNC